MCKQAILVVITSIFLSPLQVNADQQQWGTTYVGWKFNGTPPNAWMIDQEVWIPIPGVTNYFTVNWNFTTSNNGYLGIQPDQGAGGKGSARFSIWNAVGARNGTCSAFGHEGSGYSCTTNFIFNSNKFYRLRLWRLDKTTTGQWWGAWLIEQDTSGKLVEHKIGEIQAQPGNTEIRPDSISNFSETPGTGRCSLRECFYVRGSPWAPPKLNHHGTGTDVYDAIATKSIAITPTGNICKTGAENQGAFHTHRPHRISAMRS